MLWLGSILKNCRFIESIIENQELDNVTNLQLVQPLSFGDTVLCYHRKIKQLILERYCRYHRGGNNSRVIADPAPNHNEHTDEFDLFYCILQGF